MWLIQESTICARADALITKSTLSMKKTEHVKTTKNSNQPIKYVLVCLNPFHKVIHITSSIVSLSVEVSYHAAIGIDLAGTWI